VLLNPAAGQYGPFLACSRLRQATSPCLRRPGLLFRTLLNLEIVRYDGFQFSGASTAATTTDRASLASWRFRS
jgi:hypothetical protein